MTRDPSDGVVLAGLGTAGPSSPSTRRHLTDVLVNTARRADRRRAVGLKAALPGVPLGLETVGADVHGNPWLAAGAPSRRPRSSRGGQRASASPCSPRMRGCAARRVGLRCLVPTRRAA